VIRWFRLARLLDAAAAADMLAWVNSGFSVDASVRIALLDRDVPSNFRSLEHLLRYCARPPFALDRLSVLRGPDGRIARRVGEEFPLECPNCGGDIRLIAFRLLAEYETIPGLRTLRNLERGGKMRRTLVRTVHASCLKWMAIVLVGWGMARAGTEEQTKKTILLPADIRKAGILSVLDQPISVRVTVRWEYSAVKIPEDPRSADEVAKQAGPLMISLGTAGFEGIEESQRHVRAEGGVLRKGRDAKGREIYVVGETDLVNGKEYVLSVRIRLRAGFKPEMLQNPAFVKQSENPVYWSQTFHAEILAVE
jgi:hypothetical protein